MSASFDRLVGDAAAAPLDGWDFSWLTGRAREQRPSWGYQRLLGRRLATVSAAVDLQTGGGEVLAGVDRYPPTMAATESWPPNAARATALLHPRGVVVVTPADRPPLPFADAAFDLVTSRHPNTLWWTEIARILRPGGGYLGQHVGPASAIELVEFLCGPRPQAGAERAPEAERAAASAAGLEVLQARLERLEMEFYDVGAVVYFLRKVIWLVPDFTVDTYRDRLRELHRRIAADGRFTAHASRVLFEARKPG